MTTYSTNAQPFAGSEAAITIPVGNAAGQNDILLITLKPTPTNLFPPNGWSLIAGVSGTVGSTRAYRKTTANSAAQVYQFQFQDGLNNPVSCSGVIGYHSSNKVFDASQTATATNSTAPTCPDITAPSDSATLLSVSGSNQFPRNQSTADSTEVWDASHGNGPSMAMAEKVVNTGAAGTVAWAPNDFWDTTPNNPPEASDAENFQLLSLILVEPTAATPGNETLTGGGIIPIVSVSSVTISAPSTMAVDQIADFTVTVTGSDGQPFSGLTVSLSLPTSFQTASTSLPTDSNGQAIFPIKALLAGTRTIQASVGGISTSKTIAVGGKQVTLLTSATQILEGQTVILSGEAEDSNGVPIANSPLLFTFSGATWEPVGTQPINTTAAGSFVFQVQATSAGTLTVYAEVDGTQSAPVSITVTEVGDPPVEEDDLRLRSKDYTRTKPVKR